MRVGIIGEPRNFMSYAMLAESLRCEGVDVVWFVDASLSKEQHERRYGKEFRPGFLMRLAEFLVSPFRRRQRVSDSDCAALCRERGIPLIEPQGNSINSGLPARMYAESEADYAVIAGCDQILDEKGLSIARKKLINFHYSLLPAYRGKNAIFWQWFQREPAIGYSFHEVDLGVDTGRLVLQGTVDYEQHEHLNVIAERTITAAAQRLPDLYRHLESGTTSVVEGEREASYYSIRDYRELETMTRSRRVSEVVEVLERVGWMRLQNGLTITSIVDSGSESIAKHELRRDGIRVPLADGYVTVGFRSRVPFWLLAFLIGRANMLRGLD